MKIVSNGPINNQISLVQKTAWVRKDDEPLSGPTMVGFTNANVHHSASINKAVGTSHYRLFNGVCMPVTWFAETAVATGLWLELFHFPSVRWWNYRTKYWRFPNGIVAMLLGLKVTGITILWNIWESHPHEQGLISVWLILYIILLLTVFRQYDASVIFITVYSCYRVLPSYHLKQYGFITKIKCSN